MTTKNSGDTASILRGGKKGIVARLTFFLLLCVGGWYSSSVLFPATSATYRLRVDFESASFKTVQEIDTDVLLGIPFAIRTQDALTNQYTLSGTLLQLGEKKFQINLGKIEWKGNGFSLGVPGPEPLNLDLGGEWIGAHGIGGVCLEGYRIRLTKN
jgi:hypothetical protein